MSLSFEVGLISGKTVSLQTHGEESVESLRLRAQKALRAGKGRLVDSNGSVVDGAVSLKWARLQHAEPLVLQVRRVDLYGGKAAFAAILGDGSVVIWGDAGCGDSSAVGDQLNNVQQIQATERAFAAILADGSVVTWGIAGAGGDSSAVRDQLKNVQQIQATSHAFAAILGDGSVVTWGDINYGGDSDGDGVQDLLKNVQQWGLCCDPRRRFRRHLGHLGLSSHGRQQWRAASADQCAADTSN